MTKSDLVDELATELDAPKAQVRRMVDALVETVTSTLVRGEKVQVSGLGTFEVRKRAAREGRNPQTGAKITIGARNAVGFKAAKPLKEAVK
ncbi:DNA-binding protein [candidate division WWE3 bacterium CG_4_9_14_3_um_filter_34_6]|uniref:DNA-binding protein n=1 Tax=candidate division WWE3 bacterium CG_4_9_14_3_um_filter_34_6 TaxID=1975079 RepID=A0A2M7X5Z7_UNCKA|nr:MAG: DNA-binding protein [candidate division WWE3 bacterium CG_4_9_14_3_um_filter_34_6]